MVSKSADVWVDVGTPSSGDDDGWIDISPREPKAKSGFLDSLVRQNEANAIESGADTGMTDLPRDTGPLKSGLPNSDVLDSMAKPEKFDSSKAEDISDSRMRVGRDGEAGWGENLLKNAENGLTTFKEWMGGRIQRLGEATKEDLLATGDASGLAPIDYTGSRDALAKQIEDDKDKNVKTPGTLANFGKSIYDAAAADIKANTPDVAEGSLKSYVGMAVQSLVQMVPTLAATFATRNPTIGLGLMAEQTYGTQYGQARNESNRTPQQARADATFYALAETIPEELPLEILMKPGGKFLPKLMKTVGAEAVQEMFTQVLESGYDKETINPNMTWGEAWKQVKDAGIVGAMVGGGMSVAHTAVEAARPGEPPKPEQDNSKVDAYIQHRDNQLSGGLGDFAPGKEPVAAANPRGWETNPISEGTVLGGTESTEGGAPALDAAPPADTVTPQQKVSVDAVLAAPDVDSAIAAAAEAAVASPTGAPRASLDQMIDETKKSLDQDLPNLRSKRQAAVDQLYANNRDAIAEPLEAWEPDPAKPDAGAVTPEFANAAREHFAKYGVDVVFVKDIGEKGFDGVVDERQPNTVFISSNPTRAVAQISMHELGHTFEGVKLPDGSNLNQMLKQQLAEGLTSDAGLALKLHSQTAPARSSFPLTPEGQAAHADAVLDHLYNELGKDMIGDAPRFTGFVEKVIGAVEERYGKNVATDVLGKLMTSLRETFNTLQQFFKPSRMFETDKWVNNLDQIHNTIAKMHAAKIGEAQGLKDVAPTAENVVTDAIVNKEANPTRAGPAPREGYAAAKQQAEVYKRWLGELDTKRRTDADKSPEVAHLRSQEKQILDKVHGREKYLTKTAKTHLEKVRAAIEARVNPKEDNEDMAVVRAKMVEAHARMAKAAEVTKEKAEEAPAKKPASGEPVRIGKPAPRPAETGNPTEEDRFVANQMAQDTGNGMRFSPRKTDARKTTWGTSIDSIDHAVEKTPEFKKFFKGSEVVDKNGDPLVMYHATVKEGGFTSFDTSKIKPNDLDAPFNGFWFTSDPDASPAMVNPNHTMAVYLSIKNPAPVEVWRQLSREVRRDFNNEENIHPESRGAGDELRLRLRDMGYDGVHWDGPPEVNAKELEEKGETTFKTVRGATYTLKWEDGDGYRSLDLYSPSVGHITGYSDLNDYLSMNSENVWVAFEPGQIKSATSNSGAFDTNNPDIRFSPKVEEKGPVFFSALERAVDGVKFDKAPPGQWLATIKNMPGIKAEEIKTTGIDKWLGAQTRPVTKAEVLEQLEVGSVQVEEVTKDNNEEQTKFEEYALPGGKDYRELLLTLPVQEGPATKAWQNEIARLKGKYGNNFYNGGKMTPAERRTLETLHRAAGNGAGDPNLNFKSQHWDEPNVLAHIRFDTRTGPNGEKILHIAEIQSDWHQKGRKEGYRGTEEEIARLQSVAKTATDAMYAIRERKMAEASGGKYTTKTEALDAADKEAFTRMNQIDGDPEVAAASEAQDKAVAAYRAARGGVPDAPFKTTWHELAMKRAMRYAAENGYARVTWDTGDTNADRYDLSKSVDHIDWYKTATGKYNIDVYGLEGNSIYEKTIAAEEISDVVGKDIADSIINSEKREGTIKGEGLKVGGSGMRGFYDKILPAFVDKYVKKWGTKVQDSVVPTGEAVWRAKDGEHPFTIEHPDVMTKNSDGLVFVRNNITGDLTMPMEYERAHEYIEEELRKMKSGNTTPVHSLNITPQMRADIMRGQPKFSPKIKISKPGKDVADKNVHGFAPSLRVRVLNPPKFALNSKGEPQTLLTQTTTNGNAGKQLENLDDVLSKFKNPTKSPEAWSEMMAYALGGSDVPIPPYAFIRDLNSTEATNKVSALSAGQIEDATHGFEQAAKFRAAYESGQLTPVTTGKLFLWSFLSRGVSPYVQEGLFIDAFDGAAPWIQRAADGNFTKDDMPEYEAWARSAAPKGSGQPGAGATHNLNAFGNNFLVNMALKDETGKTRMQHLHEMFSDPNMTGQQIRREFMKFGEGVGIDNKVVSFTLLVAGHSDVMVIDRVQTRQLWDDGRFKDINIYDGQKDAEGKVITGTPLANLTYGVRGLLAYEAIERGLQAKIGDIYAAAGRPQDASVGRYHWESWVAYSQQEASHGTLGAILDDATGSAGRNASAIADVTAKQGEYGAYEYGARYGRDGDNQPFFRYDTPSGGRYEFSVPAFRSFLEEIKKPANGVVPSKFKVTESGNEAWYERPEVNRARLDDVARRFADRNREGALPRALPGQDVAGGSFPAGAGAQPYAEGIRLSPRLDTTRQLRSDRAGDAGSSRSYTREGGRDGGGGRLLKSLGVTYAAEWKAGKDLRESYTAAGTNIPARVLELEQTDANARRFADLITAAKNTNRFGAAVAVYPVEDYKGFRLMLADNGKSGVAVKPDGDIVSVFSTDKSGSAMMEVAVAAGGVKLDAFDTILPKFYHRFGFVEAARTSWNDEYAPEGWDKDLYKEFNDGKPDVVLMVLDPKEMSAELQRAPVYPSWDEAAEAQERLLEYLHPTAPEGATINLRLDRLDGGRSFTVDEARAVVEDTGARVIAERARRIYGKSGAPAVAMQLDRALTPEEADTISTRLKQDAISQFADGQGEVLGPNAAKWGPFDPSKFQTVESASFSPRVPSTLREKMIRQDPTYAAMFGNNAGPSSTTVVDLPPIPDRAPRRRAQQPIDGTGETRFRAINGEAYDVGEEKPQLDRAARLVAEDPERALAIAMLEAKSLTGVHPQFVFIELEKAAIANNDYALQERLSRSPISELATTQGQQTAAWRNRLKDTPAEAMRQIRLAREARGKARGIDPEAKINETVERGLRVSRATAKSTKRASLNDMIMQLVCKT